MSEQNWGALLKMADEVGQENAVVRGLAAEVRYLLGVRDELRRTNQMLADAMVVGTRQQAVTQAMPWTEEANARQGTQLIPSEERQQRPPYYRDAQTLAQVCPGPAPSGEARLDGLADAVAEVGRDWLEQGELPLVPRRDVLVDRGGKSLEIDEGHRYDEYRQEWVPR